MKRLVVLMLVLAMLIFSGSVLAQNSGNFEAKIGADILGNIEASDSGISLDEDTDMGITLIGEYKVPMNSQWVFGAGIAYQLDRAADASGAEDFNYTSFYGIAQYKLVDNPMYLIGKLGYNTLYFDNTPSNIDVNGGLYYGFGAGTYFGQNNNYVAEALYSVNNGKFEADDGSSADIDYSKFTISLGMKF